MKPEASVKIWCAGYRSLAVRSNWNHDDSSKTAIKGFSTRMAKVRVDVVLDHLRNMEKEGLVKKERMGKYFLWSLVKDAN